MQILVSNNIDPNFNIAAEKTLLTERLHDVLFLYINSSSVIVGRNQNPEAEVDIEFCRDHNIPVVIRMSGGGTVYHDTGNINFAFIINRGNTPVLDTDFLQPVVECLKTFGVDAVVGSRKELLVGGLKVSGTASHVTKNRILFHGTLLYDTDMEMLHRAINGDISKRARKVASVPSPVLNLKTIIGDDSCEVFFCKFANLLSSYYATETRLVNLEGDL